MSFVKNPDGSSKITGLSVCPTDVVCLDVRETTVLEFMRNTFLSNAVVMEMAQRLFNDRNTCLFIYQTLNKLLKIQLVTKGCREVTVQGFKLRQQFWNATEELKTLRTE